MGNINSVQGIAPASSSTLYAVVSDDNVLQGFGSRYEAFNFADQRNRLGPNYKPSPRSEIQLGPYPWHVVKLAEGLDLRWELLVRSKLPLSWTREVGGLDAPTPTPWTPKPPRPRKGRGTHPVAANPKGQKAHHVVAVVPPGTGISPSTRADASPQESPDAASESGDWPHAAAGASDNPEHVVMRGLRQDEAKRPDIPPLEKTGRTQPCQTPLLEPMPVSEVERSRFLAEFEGMDPVSCWIWPRAKDRDGYGKVWIGGFNRMAHRVMYSLVNGHLTPVVRHRCNVPGCCNPAHLLGGTQSDNVRDRQEAGRQAQGEHNGRAKLREADVRDIRRKIREKHKQVNLAREYGVHQTIISAIKHGKSWKHVEDLPLNPKPEGGAWSGRGGGREGRDDGDGVGT